VEVFLRRLHLRPDQYLFACASRLCSERVFRRIERLLPENRVTLQGRFAVAMPENYIPVFNIDPPEVRQDMERKLGINAEDFVRRIRNRETVHMSDGWWRLLTWTIFPLLTMIYRLTGFFRLARRLYADERCTVCGQCARLCLAERISMDTGRPRWDTDRVCYHCLACLHFCPQEAIQIRRTKSAQRKRYHHRAVSAAEITAQKGH
jgi:ferredoxin